LLWYGVISERELFLLEGVNLFCDRFLGVY
jgi:hypothetical protein